MRRHAALGIRLLRSAGVRPDCSSGVVQPSDERRRYVRSQPKRLADNTSYLRHVARWYSRDDRILGDVLAWTDPSGTPIDARSRLSSYDGKGRVAALREATTSSSTVIDDWYRQMDDPAIGLQLAEATGSAFRSQSEDIVGGRWHTFSRTTLGTLKSETVDEAPWWDAEIFDARALYGVDSPLTEGHQSVTWDARGLMTSRGTTQLEWTADKRLRSVDTERRAPFDGAATEVVEDYRYDGYGRLVRVVRNGIAMDRVYAGQSVLREMTQCGERVWWPTGRLDKPGAYTMAWDPRERCDVESIGVAQYEAGLDLLDLTPGNASELGAPMRGANSELRTPDGAFFGVMQDLHGNVVATLDADGEIVEVFDYDAHGARTRRPGPNAQSTCESTTAQVCGSQWGNSRGYTGRFVSSGTGLYEMRARHYDPHLRTWTGPDPFGYVDGFDVWLFVGGDPVNRWDPMGMEDFYDQVFSWAANCDDACNDTAMTVFTAGIGEYGWEALQAVNPLTSEAVHASAVYVGLEAFGTQPEQDMFANYYLGSLLGDDPYEIPAEDVAPYIDELDDAHGRGRKMGPMAHAACSHRCLRRAASTPSRGGAGCHHSHALAVDHANMSSNRPALRKLLIRSMCSAFSSSQNFDVALIRRLMTRRIALSTAPLPTGRSSARCVA